MNVKKISKIIIILVAVFFLFFCLWKMNGNKKMRECIDAAIEKKPTISQMETALKN